MRYNYYLKNNDVNVTLQKQKRRKKQEKVEEKEWMEEKIFF